MLPQEVKDNIGRLAFLTTGVGSVVYIDNLLLEVSEGEQDVEINTPGRGSGFVRSEDLVLLPPDIQAWWKEKGMAAYKKGYGRCIEDRFKSGDLVQLMSGGPIMTVEHYSHSSVLIANYFNERNELQTVNLREGSLRRVKPDTSTGQINTTLS
jgi:uncharacterized protein YodC (DUF2158 family)